MYSVVGEEREDMVDSGLRCESWEERLSQVIGLTDFRGQKGGYFDAEQIRQTIYAVWSWICRIVGRD